MKLLLVFLSVFTGNVILFAQNIANAVPLKIGDKFIVEHVSHTSSLFLKDKDTLNIGTRITVDFMYEVNAVSDNGYIFIANIISLYDTVNALDTIVYYNSKKLNDTASIVEKGIKRLLDKTDTILTNKKGLILSSGIISSRQQESFFNDTLAALAGLPAETFISRGVIKIFPGFYIPSFEKGFKWSDTTLADNSKTAASCLIQSTSDTSVTLELSKSITGNYANTNAIEIVEVDKRTGIILSRLVQNVTSEYEILKGALFSIGRRSAITENCRLLSKNE